MAKQAKILVRNFIFIFCFFNISLFAEEKRHAISLGIHRNIPVYLTLKNYSDRAAIYPSVGYSYHAPYSFLLGISGQVKEFYDKNKKTTQSLFVMSETFLYKIRLYHPYYGLVGGQFLYLYPIREVGFPLHRQRDLVIDAGVSFMLGMEGKINQNWQWTMLVSRWRGTKSNLWHGIELSFYLSYLLD